MDTCGVGILVPEEGVDIPKSRLPYLPEFRGEAVCLVRDGGRIRVQLAHHPVCSDLDDPQPGPVRPTTTL
ncbi:MAG TPA: hypothetical protein VIO57_16440 [Chloroflexota bacterium]